MGVTKIAWCDFTANFWRGCTKVSPGCLHCYAESGSRQNPKVLGEWGPNGNRSIAAEAYWNLPRKWDEMAARKFSAWAKHVREYGHGSSTPESLPSSVVDDWLTRTNGEPVPYRSRVFCLSLGDFFEGSDTMPESSRVPVAKARARAFTEICKRKNLDWLLLTKRPENILDQINDAILDLPLSEDETIFMLRDWYHGKPPANVWLGTSVEDQKRAELRVRTLCKVPARVHFASVEPQLGPIDLTRIDTGDGYEYDALKGELRGTITRDILPAGFLDWVIVGGESGPGARNYELDWARSLLRQCNRHGRAFFMKQLGACAIDARNGIAGRSLKVPEEAAEMITLRLKAKKGEDEDEFPLELRVRRFPVLADVGDYPVA